MPAGHSVCRVGAFSVIAADCYTVFFSHKYDSSAVKFISSQCDVNNSTVGELIFAFNIVKLHFWHSAAKKYSYPHDYHPDSICRFELDIFNGLHGAFENSKNSSRI